jgi:acyl-[acyl-carrier-protein]-phospholipid O-acyltransferase / long-chain-fatty-acid--[acyl-carrier-protein] ligase
MKAIVRFLLRVCFGFRAYNEEVLRAPGPVLLIPNHLTWIDWLLLVVCLDKDWRFVTSKVRAETTWLHRLIMINQRTFPIETTSPYAVKHMAEFLQSGGRLVLFAEGRLSRTGSLMKLFDGTGFLLYKTRAKVITCYLRGAGQQKLTVHPNWKRWFPTITLHFSKLHSPPGCEHVSTTAARYKLTNWLRGLMLEQQFWTETKFGPKTLPDAILETARLRPGHIALEDVTRQKLNYRRLFLGVKLLAGQWKDLFGDEQRERIGVLLPNANAFPVTLLSLWSVGKIPAILNYSTGPATMLAGARLAGLKKVITSRTFLERAKLDIQPLINEGIEFLYLEEVRTRIPKSAKLLGLAGSYLRGVRLPEGAPSDPEATAVILFTSGSEGLPKGVELTHANILANLRQMLSVIDLMDSDRFFTALPLFHSFGLTVGAMLPLVRGMYVFLYPTPLHYRIVPTAVYDLNCTVMFGTNTFLSGYARKAHPYDFRTVRYLFAGAEKLQDSTFNTWARRFGVRILEGYGATECSPCIAANTPVDPRPGSAGKILPAIEHRLEPVEGVEEGGRLWVRGPNVMRGYLNPDANEHFKSLGGWYDTGDIVKLDDDGFLYILGRLKRFAKISGEMVSLTAVEDALSGAFPDFGLRFQAAVLSRPDPDKGEVLIILTNEPKLKLEAVRAVLREKGFSNLHFPREIQVVREIPKLGSGKVNYRELEKMVE